jgi:hypothetical protein
VPKLQGGKAREGLHERRKHERLRNQGKAVQVRPEIAPVGVIGTTLRRPFR